MSVNDTDWKFVANLAIIEKTLALFRKISGNSGQWRLKKRRKRESVQQQWNFSVKIKQWKINWSNFKTIYFLPWILKKSKKPSKSDFQAWILPKKCATQLLKIWQFVCPNSPEKLYSPVNKWRDLFLLMFSREISIFRDQSFWLLTKVSNLEVVAICDNCMAFPAVQGFLLSDLCYVPKFDDLFCCKNDQKGHNICFFIVKNNIDLSKTC